MTIGDRIRAMSDDEIAEFIEKARRDVWGYYDYLESEVCLQCKHYAKDYISCTIVPESICGEEEFQKKCPCVSDFKGEITKWLKKEVQHGEIAIFRKNI